MALWYKCAILVESKAYPFTIVTARIQRSLAEWTTTRGEASRHVLPLEQVKKDL